MVEGWIEEEKGAMSSDIFEQTSRQPSQSCNGTIMHNIILVTTEWRPHYFQMLQSFYLARSAIM